MYREAFDGQVLLRKYWWCIITIFLVQSGYYIGQQYEKLVLNYYFYLTPGIKGENKTKNTKKMPNFIFKTPQHCLRRAERIRTCTKKSVLERCLALSLRVTWSKRVPDRSSQIRQKTSPKCIDREGLGRRCTPWAMQEMCPFVKYLRT